jgi:hypothetical protein
MVVVLRKYSMGMKMSMIRTSCAALLFAFSISNITTGVADEPNPGSISFYSGNTFLCRLPIKEGQTNLFDEEKDCRAPGVADGYFQLENVRSAVTIVMSHHFGYNLPTPRGCVNSDSFEYILRTNKNDLSTEKVLVSDLNKYNVDLPIIPGLLLKKKYKNEFSANYYTVGCLRIYFD